MAEKFDEFLEEVESDIRQERFMKLWQTYGKMISTAVVLLFVSFAGYTMWQKHQTTQRAHLAEMFLGAQEMISQGKVNEAISVMQSLHESSHSAYPVLAKLVTATLLSEEGPQRDMTKASHTYESLINDASAEKNMRDLARLLLVNLKLNQIPAEPNQEKTFLKGLLNDLSPLLNAENPWYHLALEFKGIIQKQNGDIAAAAETFTTLAQDPKTPEGIRMRVQLLSQLIVNQLEDHK